MAIGPAKDWTPRFVTVPGKDRGEIQDVDPAPAQFPIEFLQKWSGIIWTDRAWESQFVRIDGGFRRDRHEQQLDPALAQLPMKIDDRRNRIGPFRLVCAIRFSRRVSPETSLGQKAEIAGEKQPAIGAPGRTGIFFLERRHFPRQIAPKRLLIVRKRNLRAERAVD